MESLPPSEMVQTTETRRTKFNALVKPASITDVMIAGAKQLAAEESQRGRIGTQYVAQTMTWLNQQRWTDHAATAFAEDDGMIEILDQLQLEAWDAHGIDRRQTVSA